MSEFLKVIKYRFILREDRIKQISWTKQQIIDWAIQILISPGLIVFSVMKNILVKFLDISANIMELSKVFTDKLLDWNLVYWAESAINNLLNRCYPFHGLYFCVTSLSRCTKARQIFNFWQIYGFEPASTFFAQWNIKMLQKFWFNFICCRQFVDILIRNFPRASMRKLFSDLSLHRRWRIKTFNNHRMSDYSASRFAHIDSIIITNTIYVSMFSKLFIYFVFREFFFYSSQFSLPIINDVTDE